MRKIISISQMMIKNKCCLKISEMQLFSLRIDYDFPSPTMTNVPFNLLSYFIEYYRFTIYFSYNRRYRDA